MSNVPGLEIETLNTLVAVEGAPVNAIAVIGHVGATIPAGVDFFTATADGSVLEFGSLTDALDQLGGRADGASWEEGVPTSGAGATTPHDPKDNLLRAIDLIYKANTGAKVYACVLDGVVDPLTTTKTIPDGAQRALDVLLDHQDVAFIIMANIDPIAAGKTHAEDAALSTNPYNSPRFYVTGLDQFTLWDDDSGNGVPTGGIKTADFATWIGIKSAIGLVLNQFGNHVYDFSRVIDSEIETDVIVEIGGQLSCAWLAGVLSAHPDNFGVTNFPGLGISWYNGKKYNYKSKTELDNIIAEGYVTTRFNNNSYIISKGVTFTSDISWKLYPHRQITNGIHKTVAINLFQYIGESQTTSLFIAAQQTSEQFMDQKKSAKFISTYEVDVKPDPDEVDAIQAVISFETIKPVNKIKVTMSVS